MTTNQRELKLKQDKPSNNKNEQINKLFMLKKKPLKELNKKPDMLKCKLIEKLKKLNTKPFSMPKDQPLKKKLENTSKNLLKLNKSEINRIN